LSSRRKGHGNWIIKKEGDVIFSIISGIWNKEAALSYFDYYKGLKYNKGFYAEICSILDWELSTPEAIELLPKIEEWHRTNGRKYLAIIANENTIAKHISQNAMNQFELPENFEIRYFKDVQSSFDWLSEKGFSISSEEKKFFKNK